MEKEKKERKWRCGMGLSHFHTRSVCNEENKALKANLILLVQMDITTMKSAGRYHNSRKGGAMFPHMLIYVEKVFILQCFQVHVIDICW